MDIPLNLKGFNLKQKQIKKKKRCKQRIVFLFCVHYILYTITEMDLGIIMFLPLEFFGEL